MQIFLKFPVWILYPFLFNVYFQILFIYFIYLSFSFFGEEVWSVKLEKSNQILREVGSRH